VNFFTYIGISPQEFQEQYIETDYVSQQKHAEFPLVIYAYGRKTVKEQKWDAVTSKCRGIVVNRETGEVIARPFEKFHNFGAPLADDVLGYLGTDAFQTPVVWEKLDGFMCTLYTWGGVDYIASKGSFHSVHAKWATAWLRKNFGASLGIPAGFTAVFEGLHRDLRIVVDYGKRQELSLLSIINNETGEEMSPGALHAFADGKGLTTPAEFNLTLEQARIYTMGEDQKASEEGYVLTWYQKGKPPFRLKMKFIEYLRLHRMVTGVSPKRIWEVLATKQSSELDEYLKQSTPWFSAFVNKWLKALTTKFEEIDHGAEMSYGVIQGVLNQQWQQSGSIPVRKDWALIINRPEFQPYASALFAKLDGKDIKPIIWKMVKPMTAGANPLVDAHA
jgi:RNA ligase